VSYFDDNHILIKVEVSNRDFRQKDTWQECAVVGIDYFQLSRVQPDADRWKVLQASLREAIENVVARTLCLQVHLGVKGATVAAGALRAAAGQGLPCVVMAWHNVAATNVGPLVFSPIDPPPPKMHSARDDDGDKIASLGKQHQTRIVRVLEQADMWTPRFVMHLPVNIVLPPHFLTTLNQALLFVASLHCVNKATFASVSDPDSGMAVLDGGLDYCLSKQDVDYITRYERNPWTGRAVLDGAHAAAAAAKMDIASVAWDDWFSRVAYEANGPKRVPDPDGVLKINGNLLHSRTPDKLKRFSLLESEEHAGDKLRDPITVYRGVYVRELPIELVPLHVDKQFDLLARQPYSWTTDIKVAQIYAAKGGTRVWCFKQHDILFDSTVGGTQPMLASFSEVRTRPGVFRVEVFEFSRHGPAAPV